MSASLKIYVTPITVITLIRLAYYHHVIVLNASLALALGDDDGGK